MTKEEIAELRKIIRDETEAEAKVTRDKLERQLMRTEDKLAASSQEVRDRLKKLKLATKTCERICNQALINLRSL